MPRPNTGPRLVGPRKPPGYAQPVYFIRWFEHGRKRERSTGTGDLGPAQEALAAFITARAPAQAGAGHPHETMIARVLAIYGAEHAANKADPDRIGYATDALLRFWGEKTVDTIKTETCRRYMAVRGVAPATVRRELGTLSAALEYCAREGHLTSRPPVWLPPKTEPRDRWLSRKEVAALLRAARKEVKARGHLPLFILLGIYTAARSQAILGLRWTQNTEGGWVDLVNERIDFNPVGRVQTKKRRAVIPIPRRLLTFLRYARARAETDYVVEYTDRPIGNRVRRKDRRVAPRRVASIKRSFATAIEGAGLEGWITPHTLRHTSVTWMVGAGISHEEAGRYAGMSAETAERVYAEKHPGFLLRQRDALDRRRG